MIESPDTILELSIEKLVTGGRGLARHENRVVFVPDTVPGDRVRARLRHEGRGFREADLVEILTPGPGRRVAPCPHHDLCGGCDLQHLDEDAQVAARREILLDCFRRLAGLDVTGLIEDAQVDVPTFGYRHRVRLTAHPTGLYGLKQRRSHEVVPLETCPVMAPPFETTILPWLRQLPPVDQIVVRLDGRGGWLLSLYGPPPRMKPLRKILDAAAAEDALPAGLKGVLLNNRPAWGRGYLVVHVAGHKFRVSHQSFFQTNLAATEQVLATVREWLGAAQPDGGDVVDLYCGVGLFLLALADRGGRLLGIEADRGAVADARENLRRAPVDQERVHLHEGDVDTALAAADIHGQVDWSSAGVVVDPPRTGLGKRVTTRLGELAPPAIVYLSCDPATLARDCQALTARGYRIARVRPVPMFPQTSHLESLVLLVRDPS
jgi:tRNA/tmRNA/rRNA uracil-C5-methylase (TrmA/RlmC/RlmD family)